jgi:hypothetical protein
MRKRRCRDYHRGNSIEIKELWKEASPMRRAFTFIILGVVLLAVVLVGTIIVGLRSLAKDNRPAPAASSVAQKYVDPAHRFAMTIPAGCRVDRHDGEATVFRCGQTWPSAPITYSYATVTVRPGGNRQSDLQLLVNHLVAGWQNLKLLENDRKAKLHGRPARVMFASGTDPRGLESNVEIVAAVSAGQWYALSYASPKLQWGYDSHAYLKPILAGFRPT